MSKVVNLSDAKQQFVRHPPVSLVQPPKAVKSIREGKSLRPEFDDDPPPAAA